jgi:hypothetical protein
MMEIPWKTMFQININLTHQFLVSIITSSIIELLFLSSQTVVHYSISKFISTRYIELVEQNVIIRYL